LTPFTAVDDDAGLFGDVTFELESNNEDHLSFDVVKINRKESELRVARQVEQRSYIVSYNGRLR
jgi:hypothetical protein